MKAESKQPDTSPRPLSILFADDEPSLQELMRLELPEMGHRVTVCPDGQTAITALEEGSYDLLLVDLDMPQKNGLQVIERARQINPSIDAVVLTGKSSLETAIQALRFGATDYLTKPCKLNDLRVLLERIAQHRELKRRYHALKRQLDRSQGSQELIGQHPSIQAVRKLVGRVAPTMSTVLVRGETGCGKELVARAVHQQSLRRDGPFVAINCGALPENLIESELFGHVKGAFTGADTLREGLFEMADSGTIFLDEIGELPLAMQAKLLRVLESGELRRVGDNQPRRVDVRVVCATHRDLEAMVEQGEFREDLMFRINAFEIEVPPLRERLEDLPELGTFLYRRFRPDLAQHPHPIAESTLAELCSHSWPGNVRELANVIEHATILCDVPPVLPEHLPRHFHDRRPKKDLRQLGPISLKELELVAIRQAMERHGGNRTAAAEELGVSPKTLYNKLSQEELSGARKSA
jgi:DNA-binding NtrC family response regulator